MRKRRGMSVIDFLFFAVITVSLFWFAGNIIYIEFYNSRPDVRAEIQLRQCAEKVPEMTLFLLSCLFRMRLQSF